MDLAHDGRGVARVDGQGRVRRRRAARGAGALSRAQAAPANGRGGLVEVLDAIARIASRRAALHFGICGGCSLQHLSPAAQLAAKERQLLENLQRIGNVQPAAGARRRCADPEWAYRRRARLGVKYVHKKGRVLAGFREREKPYIADIQRCEVLLEPLGGAAAGTGRAGRDLDDSREDAAGRSGGRRCARPRWCFGCWKPPGAADLEKSLRTSARQRGLQIFLQTGGLDTVRPLRADYPPLELRGGRRQRASSNSGRSISSR